MSSSLLDVPSMFAHRLCCCGTLPWSRFAWPLCIRLWHPVPLFCIHIKIGEYCAVSIITWLYVLQTKIISFHLDCCTVGILNKQEIPCQILGKPWMSILNYQVQKLLSNSFLGVMPLICCFREWWMFSVRHVSNWNGRCRARFRGKLYLWHWPVCRTSSGSSYEFSA